MKSLSIIITRPPFGTINAAEALRLASGALAFGHDVSVILVNDGVLVAKKGQNAEISGWTSLCPLLEKIATSGESKVLVDSQSASKLNLSRADLVDGVLLVEKEYISSNVAKSQRTAIF